ncbi:hypothetical protein HDU67_005367 [Dinochytrium kinnereticum]|nr:hypothetical protein HDU67_005367 [Dinochytrium kinnereticum]
MASEYSLLRLPYTHHPTEKDVAIQPPSAAINAQKRITDLFKATPLDPDMRFIDLLQTLPKGPNRALKTRNYGADPATKAFTGQEPHWKKAVKAKVVKGMMIVTVFSTHDVERVSMFELLYGKTVGHPKMMAGLWQVLARVPKGVDEEVDGLQYVIVKILSNSKSGGCAGVARLHRTAYESCFGPSHNKKNCIKEVAELIEIRRDPNLAVETGWRSRENERDSKSHGTKGKQNNKKLKCAFCGFGGFRPVEECLGLGHAEVHREDCGNGFEVWEDGEGKEWGQSEEWLNIG